jgi:Cu-processing system ATP-binding protein
VMRTGRIHATGTVQELREAAHLPLRFELQLARDAHASLDTALEGLAAHAVPQPGNAVAVHCQREAKMAVLGALSALGALVTDLRVREPSLEDVFLGYSS